MGLPRRMLPHPPRNGSGAVGLPRALRATCQRQGKDCAMAHNCATASFAIARGHKTSWQSMCHYKAPLGAITLPLLRSRHCEAVLLAAVAVSR